MKRKPLTLREKWLQSKMKFVDFWNGGTVRKRTPAEFRRLLSSRKKATCRGSNVPKYEAAKSALKLLKEAIDGDDYEKFIDAHYAVEDALKFQGSLQMEIAFLEAALEKKSDEQIKRELFLSQL